MVPISQAFSDHALKASPTSLLFLQSCFNLQHALRTTAFCDARFPDSTLLLTSTHMPRVQTLSSSYSRELGRLVEQKTLFFSWADVQEAWRPCICCHSLLQVLTACWGSRNCQASLLLPLSCSVWVAWLQIPNTYVQRVTAGWVREGAIFSGRPYLYLSVNTQCRWTWPWHTGSQSNWIRSVCTFYILRTALSIFPESYLLLASYFWASLTCSRRFSVPEGYRAQSFLRVPFTGRLTVPGVKWHLPWPGAMLQGYTPSSDPLSLK